MWSETVLKFRVKTKGRKQKSDREMRGIKDKRERGVVRFKPGALIGQDLFSTVESSKQRWKTSLLNANKSVIFRNNKHKHLKISVSKSPNYNSSEANIHSRFRQLDSQTSVGQSKHIALKKFSVIHKQRKIKIKYVLYIRQYSPKEALLDVTHIGTIIKK